MVTHDDSGRNLPDFGNVAATDTAEVTPLQSLNSSTYIMGLRTPITRVRWSHEGNTRRWWIEFENGVVAYVPDTKTLRNPTEMEIILSDALGFSVLLHPSKAQRIWKQFECNWIMECAENNPAMAGSNMAEFLDLIQNSVHIFMSDSGEEITGRRAARVFAEQVSMNYVANRYIAVQASNGMFLHFASLARIWREAYSAVPTRDAICATLYQAGFKPTHPYPTEHAGSRGESPESGVLYKASVRMWFKPDVGEVFLNDN